MNSQPPSNLSTRSCQVCAFALSSESSDTSLRCGRSYYLQPANSRKQERMDNYPVVNSTGGCEHWSAKIQKVLD